MGWSGAFNSGLRSQSITPIFRIRFLEIPGSLGTEKTINSTGSGRLKISENGVQIQGTSVTPQRWSVSFGSFAVRFVGDIREIIPWIRRGQLATLECKIGGSTWNRLNIGQVQSITGKRTNWTVQFRDFLATIQNTYRAEAGIKTGGVHVSEFQMFWDAGRSTTTTGWTSGATTMNLASGSWFREPTSGSALARCFPNGGSDYFYVKFTGHGSTSITGVASTSHPVGTTAEVNLISGDVVEYVPWLVGLPWSIMAKILTSTGVGTNGGNDKYPLSWSVGGGLTHGVFDEDDARLNRQVVKRSDGSSAYSWSFPVLVPWVNGINDYMSISTKVGQWAVQRQGCMTWRAATDPNGIDMGYHPPIMGHIKDRDIQEIISHEIYSTSYNQIYANSKIKFDPSSTMTASRAYLNDQAPALPARYQISRDMSENYNPDVSGDHRDDMASGDLKRIKCWDFYPSEKLHLRLNLSFAGLCAGDVVEITSDFLYGMYMEPGQHYNRTRAMVLSCSYDFMRSQSVVSLGIASGRESTVNS